ncbi:MAG: glycogen debranching protein GlgX [Spirochaetia bacterium]|jgi:glycogen operon protein|nr:glycogen debranching protein GlgX [Spirochaetia bacterium]
MLIQKNLNTAPGFPSPLGANAFNGGVQFAVFSRHAASVHLVIFEGNEQDSPYYEVQLDPEANKTGDIWHIWVGGIGEGTMYGYRMDGPFDPQKGHRFNKSKLLLDPYARALTRNFKWDLSFARPPSDDLLGFSDADSLRHVPRSVVISRVDHIRNKSLNHPAEQSVIYELHVKGFTYHKSSGVQHPGTYRGLIEKIPYLKELGVTAVELLPVQEFDEFDNINKNPETGENLKNFWGYSTLAFFAPKGSYSAGESQVNEFLEMIRAMHEADIEVILDVVFNHTGEGDHHGPTLSFRGIDNSIYYMLDDEKQYYKNYSGCGNTFNCNHPFVRLFIMDCLRYWAIEIGVDGFRFDLAAILGRDQDGNILVNPPIIELIEQDPILRHVKIIAEAWDAAGAYKVGDFPGRWKEWNGRYRDDVRRFWRGDDGCAGIFATRICGSADLYKKLGPGCSINFITCHDGFTLNDLVSYNEKHNAANGEENRDGENHNLSCNFGSEGPDDSPEINALRLRQTKNFIATLFLSRGVPMITSGDEFSRTKNGNNNTYCQDNDLSWLDWGLLEKNSEMFGFTKKMIAFRKAHPLLRSDKFFHGIVEDGCSTADVSWYDAGGNAQDWDGKLVIMLLNGQYAEQPDNDICIIFNSDTKSVLCEIPPAPSGKPWNLVIDTFSEPPLGIQEPETWKTENRYNVHGKSLAVLVAEDVKKAPL